MEVFYIGEFGIRMWVSLRFVGEVIIYENFFRVFVMRIIVLVVLGEEIDIGYFRDDL